MDKSWGAYWALLILGLEGHAMDDPPEVGAAGAKTRESVAITISACLRGSRGMERYVHDGCETPEASGEI